MLSCVRIVHTAGEEGRGGAALETRRGIAPFVQSETGRKDFFADGWGDREPPPHSRQGRYFICMPSDFFASLGPMDGVHVTCRHLRGRLANNRGNVLESIPSSTILYV